MITINGADWCYDRMLDEPWPCDDCGKETETGFTCLDGGAWVCDTCFRVFAARGEV